MPSARTKTSVAPGSASTFVAPSASVRRAAVQGSIWVRTSAPNSVFRRSTATSNCIGPTPPSTGTGSWLYSRRSTCTTPSWSSCSSPRRNCLKRPESRLEIVTNDSGVSVGIAGKRTGGALVQRVADAHVAAEDDADDVAREGLVEHRAVLAEDLVRVVERERRGPCGR